MKITSESEYQVTKARVENPEQALAAIAARTDLSPEMKSAHREGLLSNLETLASELREYESGQAEGRPLG